MLVHLIYLNEFDLVFRPLNLTLGLSLFRNNRRWYGCHHYGQFSLLIVTGLTVAAEAHEDDQREDCARDHGVEGDVGGFGLLPLRNYLCFYDGWEFCWWLWWWGWLGPAILHTL